MDRREFLISTGGVAVAAASATAAAAETTARAHPAEGGATILRLAMPWADTFHGPGDAARRLGRRIELMTGGRYGIAVTAAGGQGLPDDADLFHGTAHDFGHLNPAFAYFAGLPGTGGLTGSDLAHWITVGGGQMLWDDLAGTHGWKPLLAGHSGEAPPLWSREPITGLGDLAGQRIVASGLGADVARGLGADTSLLSPGEIAAELKTGTVFAAEAGLLASLATGVARSAPYATGSGLNGHGTALSLNVRLAVWERLADSDKAIFTAAAAEEFQTSLAEARAHERIARDTLAGVFGVRFAPYPADLVDALERVAEATIAHVAGHDPAAARIDQSYMAFRSTVSGSAPPRRAQPIA
jgi:TRAP-type mannitol/chloroaromatic compound transport system substrate-binding protein